ncbi:dienelactone hydrolase family protein [Sphaerisporangium perillae]|uniref:dienelactone hydrolase family protein n=1 Tax=Sphaerisporangium perillae TaxID=2935860 RepID=UPI00200F1AE7|nr:dienelactone hydrolase family protein [Sphaerisporangium perillae]
MRTRRETVTVAVADGGFDMDLWTPERGGGPGLLLIQEIYGVGTYIRKVAEDLAGLGYVVGAPDLFWRLQRHWQADHDDEGLADSLKMGSRFDFELGVADSEAALGALSALPEVTGGTGLIGFCLGGSLAYALAARTHPAAVVSFYGSMVPDAVGLMDRIDAPVQFHFGGQDPYIPRDKVAQVERAVAGRDGMEIHVQEAAGHAFHNFDAPRFYHAEAAEAGWRLAAGFLARHLPAD